MQLIQFIIIYQIVWIETGSNKIIPANSGRNRVNIVGAYSPQGNRVFSLINELCQ